MKFNPFIFYRYVLKEHIGPFLFSVSLIVFLLMINFTLREAGRLFGRGLDAWIITKMFYYHMAPILSMAVPMSVILATLMAFIRMAADSEVTILRSSGVSLIKILMPLLLVSIFIFWGMFHFMNTVLPEYNIESSKLTKEISRLKPTATIYPNTFTEFKNVRLNVKKIDNTFNNFPEKKVALLGETYRDYPIDHLFDVTIYDLKNPDKAITINANEGFVLLNKEKEAFEFILFNGSMQEVDYNDKSKYQYSEFSKTTFIIKASEFVGRDVENEEASYISSRQQTTAQLQEGIERETKSISDRYKNHLNTYQTRKLSIKNLTIDIPNAFKQPEITLERPKKTPRNIKPILKKFIPNEKYGTLNPDSTRKRSGRVKRNILSDSLLWQKTVHTVPQKTDSLLKDTLISQLNLKALKTDSVANAKADSALTATFKEEIYDTFNDFIRSEVSRTESAIRIMQHSERRVFDYEGEWHKKLSIPFASVIFILIGAPLGLMTRKGEAGSAVIICLLIFLVNHICLIQGERWSEAGLIPAWVGLWWGHFINGVFALFLLYRLYHERTVEINLTPLINFLRRKRV